MTELERLTSGVPGLDMVLSGGFFKGGLYLIQGAPGTGKTTLANQICFHNARGGGRALYATLLTEHHSKMVQYIGNMSFFAESMLPDQVSYISGFNIMRAEGLSALLTLIRREVLAKRASVLVVDGLIAAQRLAVSEQAFNEFIHELQGIAISVECTMFMIASVERGEHATPEHTVVDGILELTDQTVGWAADRTLQVAKIRGTSFLRGQHSYRITDDGIIVHPRTEQMLSVPTIPDSCGTRRVTCGIAALDAMLFGGLPEESTTILVGPSGVGKTTFGLQFLSASTDAEPGLMLGFYEMPSRIKLKAAQVCKPLHALLDSGGVQILWQPPGSDALDVYAERILTAVKLRGMRRLFLDGLGALQKAPAAQQRMQHFLPALTNELRSLGVTTLYSFEAGNSVVGTPATIPFGDLSVVAENLLALRYVEKGARLHRLLSIMKVRDSDFDPSLREFTLSDTGPQLMPSSQSAREIMEPAGKSSASLS